MVFIKEDNMPTVICDKCPCLNQGEYGESCNLGSLTKWGEITHWKHVLSDDCKLVQIVTQDSVIVPIIYKGE